MTRRWNRVQVSKTYNFWSFLKPKPLKSAFGNHAGDWNNNGDFDFRRSYPKKDSMTLEAGKFIWCLYPWSAAPSKPGRYARPAYIYKILKDKGGHPVALDVIYSSTKKREFGLVLHKAWMFEDAEQEIARAGKHPDYSDRQLLSILEKGYLHCHRRAVIPLNPEFFPYGLQPLNKKIPDIWQEAIKAAVNSVPAEINALPYQVAVFMRKIG
jgi:hypothetical protein